MGGKRASTSSTSNSSTKNRPARRGDAEADAFPVSDSSLLERHFALVLLGALLQKITDRFKGQHSGPLTIVVLGYLVSRIFFRVAAGIQFDARPLTFFWQFIDPLLLKTDPWQSLYYHHAQPPLFNLYHVIVLALSGDDPSSFYWITFVLMGLVLHAAIYGLLVTLGVRSKIAVLAALLFALSPASILYENWLFYTYPMAALLTCSALLLSRVITRDVQRADTFLFFGLLGMAALTRSLFHLGWLLLTLAVLIVLLKSHWKRLVICALVPFALVFSVYLKNWIEFDSFSASTWLGMNLAKLTTHPIKKKKKRRLYERGVIGKVSLVRPFSPLNAYPSEYQSIQDVDHPVLTRAEKSTGKENFNHLAYIQLSKEYRQDAKALILYSPARYLSNVGTAWLNFSMPPSEYFLLKKNRKPIQKYEAAWNILIYGSSSSLGSDLPALHPGNPKRESIRPRFSWTWAALALLSILFALKQSTREIAQGDRSAKNITLLFISLNIPYVAVLGNAIELGENNRFRFMIEPLIFVLMVYWLETHLLKQGSK